MKNLQEAKDKSKYVPFEKLEIDEIDEIQEIDEIHKNSKTVDNDFLREQFEERMKLKIADKKYQKAMAAYNAKKAKEMNQILGSYKVYDLFVFLFSICFFFFYEKKFF